MSNEEKAVLLSSAINQYIFDKIFAKENNGKIFDSDRWLKDIEDLTSDSMFAISKEKQEKLAYMIRNLDDYAIEDRDIEVHHEGPKLVLN